MEHRSQNRKIRACLGGFFSAMSGLVANMADPAFVGGRLSTHSTRCRSVASSEVRAHVFPHLVMPVRPFVPALRTPIIEMMSDAAIPEHLGHSIGRAAVLPWTRAGHEPDVATAV